MSKLSVYTALSRLKILSGNYALKFLFIAFLGIHIPLLAVVAVLLSGHPSGLQIFFTTLGCTLLACVATLFVLRALLEPIQRSFQALKEYLYRRELPHLPTQYPDEAGQLMRKTQLTLQQLDSLLQEKQELALLLSHDLRAPLNNIGGLANLIKEEDDPEVIRLIAGKLAEQAEGQLRFVDDILEKMRLSDRYVDALEISDVNLCTLTEQVAGDLQSQLREKQLTIQNEIAQDLSLRLDADQIGHVLQNLLTNAIKFSQPGGGIRLWAESREQQTLVHINDQGIGFDTRQAAPLFSRYTTGQTGTAGERSTGVGLYLSKKIMELHGGSILAESPGPGKGATFTLVFLADQ